MNTTVDKDFLRVMQWNVNLCKNIPGIVAHILKHDPLPHLIGLQEISEGWPNPTDPNAAISIMNQLLEQTGLMYEIVAFPALRTDRHEGYYNLCNAALVNPSSIITGLPKACYINPIDYYHFYRQKVYIKPRDVEPRVAIEVPIRWRKKDIRFIVTHLNVSKEFRGGPTTGTELIKLKQLVRGKELIILAADFNMEPRLQQFDSFITDSGLRYSDPAPLIDQKKTWPTTLEAGQHHAERYDSRPENYPPFSYRLEQILISPEFETSNFLIEDSVASDHCSLTVDLTLK